MKIGIQLILAFNQKYNIVKLVIMNNYIYKTYYVYVDGVSAADSRGPYTQPARICAIIS